MGSRLSYYHTGNKAYYIPKFSKHYAEKISILRSLKVSSLVCKCLLYQPEHNSKWGPAGIEI